jgi:hypothetical protein
MEFLRQAEAYVRDLEVKIALLEKENAEKDAEIKRLSSQGTKVASSTSSTVDSAKSVEVSPPSTTTPSAPAGGKFTRIKLPPKKEPTAQEKASLTVYEDDASLGVKAPVLSHIQWFNGDAVEVGNGKPLVMTFFSKLNKGDFGTLSLLSEISEEFKEKVNFCGISRDGEVDDVSKFPGKYHGKFFDELQSPDGKPGLTVYMTFPLGFDPQGGYNSQLKQVMKKGTIGVGMTVLIDGNGKVVWYEQFVRGVNPMQQLSDQIRLLLEGKPLISNGKAPEVQVQEEAVDLPDDVDPFAKTGKY